MAAIVVIWYVISHLLCFRAPIRCLCKEEWVIADSIKIIGNATVPVLKLKTRVATGAEQRAAPVSPVSLDISFEGPSSARIHAWNALIT